MQRGEATKTILETLMGNGRTTWADLSQKLDMSAPAVADRVRRLEEDGTIRGYAALVDPRAVGCGLSAFVHVTLDAPVHRSDFLACIARLEEIQECHHIAGEHDYLLKVRCAGTDDLDRIVGDEIKAVPGVLRTYTTVVLKTVKESVVVPLSHLTGGT